MTRGKMVLITPQNVLISCEFNGDMYPDRSGYGKEVFERLKNIKNSKQLLRYVLEFNQKNHKYETEYVNVFSESLEWLELARNFNVGYFDNWFSDWIYIRNVSGQAWTFSCKKDGDSDTSEVKITNGQTYAFNFGSDPDQDDKNILGV